MGLAEPRWKGSGDFYDDDYGIIYSGGNECQRGTAIILDKVTASCVTDIQQYNVRLMMIKINAKPMRIMILQVYLPAGEYDDSEVDEIYDHIEDVININSKGPDYIIDSLKVGCGIIETRKQSAKFCRFHKGNIFMIKKRLLMRIRNSSEKE